MTYLFAAYSVIWILIASYVWMLGKKQNNAMKELKFLREMKEQ